MQGWDQDQFFSFFFFVMSGSFFSFLLSFISFFARGWPTSMGLVGSWVVLTHSLNSHLFVHLCPPSWIDFKNINSPATPRKIQANSRAMFDRAQIIKTATGWDNNLAMNNGRSLINKLQINTQLQTPSGKSFMKVFLFSSSKGEGHEKRA